MNELKQIDAGLALSCCKVTKISLVLDENVGFDVWEEIGKNLRNIEGSIQFWVGDWINQGEQKFGEKYLQAFDATDKDNGTLRNIAWVCRNVDLSRRNDKVSFTHHVEVARLEPRAQVKWLKIAHEENLSVKELRESIRCGKLVRITQIEGDSGKNSGIPIVHGFVTGLQLWKKNVLDAGKIPWTAENVERIDDEVIQPLKELVEYLEHKRDAETL